MEQHVQLCNALNDDLKEEVQMLKLEIGQMFTNGEHMMNQCAYLFAPNQPFFKVPLQFSNTYLATQLLQQLHLQSHESSLNL